MIENFPQNIRITFWNFSRISINATMTEFNFFKILMTQPCLTQSTMTVNSEIYFTLTQWN